MSSAGLAGGRTLELPLVFVFLFICSQRLKWLQWLGVNSWCCSAGPGGRAGNK